MSLKKNSVMSELQKIQDSIQQSYQTINFLENKLIKDITINNREALELELKTAKEILKRNEETLLKLRKDNSKSFMIAACIVFIIFLLFGLYSMIFNINNL